MSAVTKMDGASCASRTGTCNITRGTPARQLMHRNTTGPRGKSQSSTSSERLGRVWLSWVTSGARALRPRSRISFLTRSLKPETGLPGPFNTMASLVNGPESHDKIDSQIIFGMILDSLDGRSPEAVAKATGGGPGTAIEEECGFTKL